MSGGNNLSPLGGYVPDMAQACNNNPQCVGFSMFGLLYDFIPNASGLTPNPGDNIFVKSFTQPKGYTVKIGQTGGSNMMSAPSAYVPMMADLCNKTAGCTGFDTSGLLKEGPITLSPNSNLNIYVKTTP
jgi:hypothetical protein